ncbi:MAG: polyprenyl synthetase family protein [Candidatus Thermoplasmatota archaeon]|nr:polyprenyl synthetase family protein [Candidatus Thermoplasmatota archaeon]
MRPSPWDFGVDSELELVEERLREMVKSEEKILTDASLHVIDSGGKRFRPTVTILSYKSLGGQDVDKIVDIAAGFELIHSATLVHDDINDGGNTRRGRETVYLKYGLHNAVVTGDFLFVKAFSLGGMFDKEVVRITSDACAKLAEGEIMQSRYRHTKDLSMDGYVRIMERKTAEPLSAGATVGAYLAGGTMEEIRCLGAYGLNLGIAFQIVDDILDFVGDEARTGKPVGTDLREGYLTLPSLIAMKGSESATKELADIASQNEPSPEAVKRCVDLVTESGAIEEARTMAEYYGKEALQHLGCLSNTQYSEALRDLVSKVLERDS